MSFILYGSQTGQSKAVAENISEVLNTTNNKFKLYELDEIDKAYILEKINICIIICSTTGDGDAPENASKFLRKIKSIPLNSLYFQYTVLGLGDTNYSNFCNCGKTIDNALNKIGGKRFYHSRWADDAVGLELVIEPWLEGLFKIMKEITQDSLIIAIENITISGIKSEVSQQESLKESLSELLGDEDASKICDIGLTVPLQQEAFLCIEYFKDDASNFNHSIVSMASLPADKSGLRQARISDIKKITRKFAIKSVHKVTLYIDDHDWKWAPGDSIALLPCNPPFEVDGILTRLGISSRETLCSISFSLIPNTNKKNPKIPEHLILSPDTQITLRGVLSWLCDIRSPLSKAGLRIMAEYCPPGSAEQRRLLLLSSKEGQMLYIKCIREPSMPILDLLNWFPSCTIPIERLLEVLPRLKPRAYSLCDCDSLTFAFSKVDIAPVQAYRKRPLTGVCTTWLESMMTRSSDITVPVYLKKNLNGFTISNPQEPHILIGPGTGVAPFIGFLQHFEKLKKRGEQIGEVWLFFGCRHRERDFIFQDQLEYYRQEGVLTHLCVCFSRDDDIVTTIVDGDTAGVCVPAKCKYVQDCMRYHCRDLASLVLDRAARVFVCGDADGLAKDVLGAWSSLLLEAAHPAITSKKDADGAIARMRINKLYLEDVWH